LARVAAFIELLSLDPKGQTNAPEGMAGFAKRYGFHKAPQNIAEIDFQKGVTFLAGRFNDIAIDQVQLFNNGIAVDTRSSTDNCLLVLDHILETARKSSGATIVPTKQHFVSHVIFRSELKLSLLHPMLQPIADDLARASSSTLNHPINFEPTGIILGADATQLKIVPSLFSLERRNDAAFSENTYFSAAPLPTAEHFKLIEKLEKALSQ
jgi:hypothetical protein